MIKIRSRRLEAEIAEPGRVYRMPRFDWTGFIVQITLDARHRFCSGEEECKGRGLCNEFGILDPIGFSEAKPGEGFPKLGVGILLKPDEKPYSFSRDYVIEPFEVEYEASDSSACFVVKERECNGYAAGLEKNIRIEDNRLEIEYILYNAGKKTIETDEYNHNFLCIDGNQIGPDYSLQCGFPLPASLPEPLTADGEDTLALSVIPARPFYLPVPHVKEGSLPRWRLIHKPSGIGVREYSGFPLARFALWGISTAISPETFFKIRIAPGEKISWKRCYEFSA